MREDPLVRPGHEIGGYRIEYHLGSGGMGTVYAAVEPTIGRRVAVKVLSPALASDASSAQRFEREARSVSSLRHPAIVDIFSFGRLPDDRPFFVMPLYQGRSLREAIAESGLPPREAWRIAREIAEGLAAAHAAGVLHRDLKPDNIFLAEVPGRLAQPVLLDFGLAKRTGADLDDVPERDRVKLTATGVPIGTPIYMAPEQWWSKPTSEATDLYAFGVVLFEMLTGRPPFASHSFPELLEAHLHRPPPTLASLGAHVPDAVEQLVARLLAKAPAERFASATEMIASGDRAFEGASADAPSRRESDSVSDPIASAQTEAAVAPSSPSAPVAPSSAGTAVAATSPTLASTEERPDRSRLPLFAACVAGVVAVFLAVGYEGEDRYAFRRWLPSAGFGGPLVWLAAAIGTAVVPRLVSSADRATAPEARSLRTVVAQLVAIAPAPLAIFSMYSGWKIVSDALDTVPDPAVAFELLLRGRYEFGLCDFMGFALAAAVSLGLASLLRARSRTSASMLRAPAAAAALLTALAIPACIALGIASATFTLFVAAASLLLVAHATAHPSPYARELSIAAIAATFSARAVSQVRADVHAASAWFEAPTRADRVVAMLRAHRDRTMTTAVTTIALFVVAIAAIHLVLRTRREGVIAPAIGWQRAFGGGLLVVLAGLFSVSVQTDSAFEQRRRDLVSSMTTELGLYARLSPPNLTASDLPAPVTSPTLQITSDAVALNGKGIGKLSALDSETGRQTIAAALFAALAQPAVATGRVPDLSLLVDRNVPWDRVRAALAIAFEGGARSVDFLLTRGREPSIPKGAPPEAASLLPRDFAALPLTLAPDGLDIAEPTFDGAVSRLLAARDNAPSLSLRVTR